MKLDILAFGAHPDDVELGAGGLLAKEAAQGKKTGIIDLTRGEMGTRGTAEIRDLEAQEAARILGSPSASTCKWPMDSSRTMLLIRKALLVCSASIDRTS